MTDHIPEASKMVSETPRTDAAHIGMGIVFREFAQELERELNAANSIIRQQQLLDEENLSLRQRIKRLEIHIDRLALERWNLAKEAKP